MAEDKALRFQFVIDSASLQKARSSIQGLISDFNKFVELSQRANIGGAGGGPISFTGKGAGPGSSAASQRIIAQTPPIAQGLVKNIVQHRDLFKSISEGSKDSFRLMTEGLKSAVATQKKELEGLDREISKVVKRYDALGSQIKDMKAGSWDQAMAPRFAAKQQEVLSQGVGLSSRRAELAQEHQDLIARGRAAGILPPPLPGSPERAAWEAEQAKAAGGVPTSTSQFNKKAALKVGAAVAFGAEGITSELMSGIRSEAALRAYRANTVRPAFSEAMGGDVKRAFVMRGLSGRQALDLTGEVDGFASGSEQFLGGLGQVGSTIAGAVPVPGAASLLGGGGNKTPGGIFGRFKGENWNTNQIKGFMAQSDALVQAMAPLLSHSIDQFASSLGQRASTQRILGVGLHERRDRPGEYVDSYGNLEAKLTGQGYSIGEYSGAVASMRGQAGAKYAGKTGWMAMAANAEGLGGFDSLMGAAGRSGGGLQFARGAIGGEIDRWAGVQLGSSIIGSGFDPRGTTNGLGVLSAAQQGMQWYGDQRDFNQVQRVGAGMGLLDQITTGGMDPYQRGRNLVAAIDRLGPGASVYSQDYLANGMNFKQMLDMGSGASELTKTAKSLGLDQGKIKDQLSDTVSSFMDRWTDTGGSDPMSVQMRAFRGSGKSLPDYLKSLEGGQKQEAVDTLGAYFGLESGQGEEAGLGAMGLLAGMGSSKVKEGRVGRKLSGVEATAMQAFGEKAKMVADTLSQIGKDLKATWESNPALAKAMSGAAADPSQKAEEFALAMGKAIGALEKFTAAIEGVPSGRVARTNDPTTGVVAVPTGSVGFRGR